MTSSSISNITEELAKDYARYAEVDLSNEMKHFHDTIEDVMIRLEEFQSIIGMVQAESTECTNDHLPRLRSMDQELKNLAKRIDALELVVATANANLCTLEAAVDNAEAELGISDRLFGILNTLSFFKKSQESVMTNKLRTYETPIIYKTDDFFKGE